MPGTPPVKPTIGLDETPGKVVRWVDEKDKREQQHAAAVAGKTGTPAVISTQKGTKGGQKGNPQPWWVERSKKKTTWKGGAGKAGSRGSNWPRASGKGAGKGQKGWGKKGKSGSKG